MKKALKIIWIIFASIVWFLIIVFAIVWVSTSWIDEKVNEVVTKIQTWDIQSLYSEMQTIEKDNWIKNWLSLEDLTNAIILPSWQADLRTLKNLNWTWKWFENNIKYVEWEWDLDNWITIKIRLDFVEKDWEYLFYWINWNAKQ